MRWSELWVCIPLLSCHIRWQENVCAQVIFQKSFFIFSRKNKTEVIEAVQDGKKMNFVQWKNACGFKCDSQSCKVNCKYHRIFIRLKEKEKKKVAFFFQRESWKNAEKKQYRLNCWEIVILEQVILS